MGFLRRKREEPTAVPDWAALFTPDEYKAFLDVVKAELGKGGEQYTMGDGFVRVARPGSSSNQLYWWHEGHVTHLPVNPEGDRIAFIPPDEFVALLNTLAAP